MQRFQSILVDVDTRLARHPALEWATHLARNNRCPLKLVTVVQPLGWLARLTLPNSGYVEEVLAGEAAARLERIAGPSRVAGVDVTTAVLMGQSSDEIVEEVKRERHDLVVRVTRDRQSGGTSAIGTTSMRLLRRCPCAVWLVRPDSAPRFTKVLSAVDVAPNDSARHWLNVAVAELGYSIAEHSQAEFHVLHAWKLFGKGVINPKLAAGDLKEVEAVAAARARGALDEFLADSGHGYGSPRLHLVRDEVAPWHAICELANRAEVDLVVMGNGARRGVAESLLGSTAEYVLDRVNCPVLFVKPNLVNAPKREEAPAASSPKPAVSA